MEMDSRSEFPTWSQVCSPSLYSWKGCWKVSPGPVRLLMFLQPSPVMISTRDTTQMAAPAPGSEMEALG